MESIKLKIKPLSVNEAWKGRRFKTDAYRSYQRTVLFMLPKMNFPPPPLMIEYHFGFSNMASDIDNPVKLMTDILQKKYRFNDKDIMEMRLKKVKTQKGHEFIHIFVSSVAND